MNFERNTNAKNEIQDNKSKSEKFWEVVGIAAISVALALFTVFVVNI